MNRFSRVQKIDTKKYKRHCFGRKVASNVGYCYDGKFEGNILIVGQTGCGKTTFVQELKKWNVWQYLKKYIGCQKYLFPWKEKKI